MAPEKPTEKPTAVMQIIATADAEVIKAADVAAEPENDEE